jgi:hypothetical protein
MKKSVILLSIIFACFVSNAQITADFTWSEPECSNAIITFTDASTGNPAVSWVWRVNGVIMSNGSTLTYTFPTVTTPTDFSVILRVYDEDSTMDLTSQILTIYPQVSIENFSDNNCLSGEYEVSFDVLSGSEPASFLVNETPYSGSYLGLFSDGEAYNLTVVDENGCGEFNVFGSHDCGCTTNAGSMIDINPLKICGNDCTPDNLHNDDATLETNDVLEFILYDTALNVLATNTSTAFCYNDNPDIEYGTNYYIAAVAGPDDGSGHADPLGSCYDIAQGVPVIWCEVPTANAGEDDEVCGMQYELNATYSLSETDDYHPSGYWEHLGMYSEEASFINSGNNQTTVTVSDAGLYRFIWRENNTDFTSCNSIDTVEIYFLDIPFVNAGDDFDVCGNSTTLKANSENGLVTWLPVNGVAFENHHNDTTLVTYSGYGAVPFYLYIEHGICNDRDTVIVNFWRHPSAELAIAEDDTTICGRVFPRIFAENPGSGVVGNWTSDPSDGVLFHQQAYMDTMEVTNYGYYDIWWTEYSGPDSLGPGFCSDTSEFHTIHFIEHPEANAGADTLFCGYSGNLNAELSVDNGSSTGSWFIVSSSIVFEEPENPESLVISGVLTTEHPDYDSFELVWTENNFGCTSSDTVIVAFAPQPQTVPLTINPTDGILESGNLGEINLTTSEEGIIYWVTLGADMVSDEIIGTGDALSLGADYAAGNYEIWSRSVPECTIFQGAVTFVEDNGGNQIIAYSSYGTSTNSLPVGEAVISLYNLITDISGEETVNLIDQQTLNSNGQVVFDALESGDYFLGSAIVNPENYTVFEHVYYQEALTHEDATSISMTGNTVFIANCFHPENPDNEGSNTAGGIIGTGGGKSSMSTLANMPVILRNAETEEIIDVSVSNASGVYHFTEIPDNTDIQIYVSSLEYPNWTAANLLMEMDTHYSVDFIVDGDEVYPGELSNNLHLLSDFRIYPNPTDGMVSISGTGIQHVAIIDLYGKIIINKSVNEDKVEIDLNGLPQAVYLVKVETAEGTRVGRIVLK